MKDQVPNKEDNKSGDDECYAAKEELENHDSNEVDGEDDEQFSSDDDADGSEKGDSSTGIKGMRGVGHVEFASHWLLKRWHVNDFNFMKPEIYMFLCL